MEINSANFKEMASRCGEELLETFRGAFDGLVSRECEDVFLRTVELGIENTMRALIEADVEDGSMVSVLCEVWGLSRKEAAARVVWLKREVAIERLKEFLILKGKRSEVVDRFCREYAVQKRLHNDDSLFEFWDKPEQLYRELSHMGPDPRPVVRPVSRA